MAIDRVKTGGVPGQAVRYQSPAAQQLSAALGGVAQVAAGLAADKRRKQDESASIERQGFEPEIMAGIQQFDTENGLDINGFTEWAHKQASAKGTPMNRAVFLGNARTTLQRRLTELKSKDEARHIRMDQTIVSGRTLAVEQKLVNEFRKRLIEDRDNGVETNIHSAAMEYANSAHAETEEGRARAYEMASTIFSREQAQLFAEDRAEKQALAVRGFTEQSRELFLAGASLDQIDSVRRDAVQTLAEDFGFNRNQIAGMQQDWLQAMIASAVKSGSLDALDRVEAINKRLQTSSEGRKVQDGFGPATFAEIKRQAENDITAAYKGKLFNDTRVWLADARTVDQVRDVKNRIDNTLAANDQRFTRTIRDEDNTALKLMMENRQAEIVSQRTSELLGPVEDGIKQPYSAAAIAIAADRLNDLALNPPMVTTLDGKEQPLIDKKTHRLMADKLRYARDEYERANGARLTVMEQLSLGGSLSKYAPDGPEAKELTKIVEQRIAQGSTLPREIVNVAQTGLVPDELVKEFGHAMLPEGTGPQVMRDFDEHFSALARLEGMSSPVARKIITETPAAGYLVELERLGVGRGEIARRAQEYGKERIEAAISLVEDGMARRGGFAAHADTPYGKMLRAQAIDNVLRVMDPIESRELQKAQRQMGTVSKSGGNTYKVDDVGQLVEKAINSAEKQVDPQIRKVSIYGRETTLPRNGWDGEGRARIGMFDGIKPENLDRQVEALVRGAQLDETEPSMYRGGFHRRVQVRPDTLESYYDPEHDRIGWRMRVDYVPMSGGSWIRSPNVPEYTQARTLGWISLMQERE